MDFQRRYMQGGPDTMANANANIRALAENRPQAVPTDMNDGGVGPQDRFNQIHAAAGDGIQAKTITLKDGRKQLMLDDSGPRKAQYVGADGNPTDKWSDTQAYKDATLRAAADKARVEQIEQRRELERNWGPKLGGLLARQMEVQERAAQGKNALSPKDQFDMQMRMAEFNRGLANDKVSANDKAGDNDREDAKFVTQLIDNASKMYGDKDAGRVRANLERFVNQYDPTDKRTGRKRAPREYVNDAIEQYHAFKALADSGEHWNTSENPWDGVSPIFLRRDGARASDALNAVSGEQRYTDQNSGMRWGSNAFSKLTPWQRQFILENQVLDYDGKTPYNAWAALQNKSK